MASTATGWLGAALIYGGMALVLLSVGIANWLDIGQNQLAVVARLDPTRIDTITMGSPDKGGTFDSLVMVGPWSVDGRVIYKGIFPEGAAVWAIAERADGQTFAPSSVLTDTTGAFRLGPIPSEFGEREATITIRARAEIVEEEDSVVREGRSSIGWGGGTGGRIDLPVNVWLIVGLFSFSILIAYWPWPDNWRWQTAKQVVIVALAFVLTASLLYQWGVGLMRVDSMTSDLPDGQSLRLGIGTIFRGTYVPGSSEDWVFSLTERAVDEESGLILGFGAPLWGILLSVVGAAVFTVWLIVRGIAEDARSLTAKLAKQRVGEIVLHEFYIVFAPVGAILVYQAAVAAGMAAEPVTVGLVLLAAGVGLNVILNYALDRLGSLWPSSGNGDDA